MRENDFDIYEKISSIKIKNIQLDPNGFCNNKCWFCPVAYSPNPSNYIHQMGADVLEKIIKNCVDLRGKLFDENFNHIWTAHYNEILLYKYLEEFFQILQKYNLKTTILSNGTTLSLEKIELLKKYDSVISAICLNVPAATRDAYMKYTSNNEETYNKVIVNINNTINAFSDRVSNKTLNLMINGVDDDHSDQRQDYLGDNAPHIPFYDLHFQEVEMNEFPIRNPSPMGWVRIGYLTKENYDL